MNSTIRSFYNPSSGTPFSMPQNQQQQYQVIYNQCVSLKKDYDSTSDQELKDALRVVLAKKNTQLQDIWSSYTSTINTQIQSVAPN
jgi:hypothetical protein